MSFEQHGLLTIKEALVETLPVGAKLFFSFNGTLYPILSLNQYKNGNYRLVLDCLVSANRGYKKKQVRVKASELQNRENLIFISTANLTGMTTTNILRHARRAATPLQSIVSQQQKFHGRHALTAPISGMYQG